MLRFLHIHNYKSLKQVNVNVGVFNVLIGENGSGKSNFLEVIALYSAASANSLRNEFMKSRGIRVVEPKSMFSNFRALIEPDCKSGVSDSDCHFMVVDNNNISCNVSLSYDKEDPFPELKHQISYSTGAYDDENHTYFSPDENSLNKIFEKQKEILAECTFLGLEQPIHIDHFQKKLVELVLNEKTDVINEKVIPILTRLNPYLDIETRILSYNNNKEHPRITDFIIYSPELSSLRDYSIDGYIEPLGVNGEGLLNLLQAMQEHELDNFNEVMKIASMFQWVEKIIIEKSEDNPEKRIKIIDRYMGTQIDHRSANEGFLFVLFYAALFSSKYTPKIFAVDNIDASLNPKLCRVLIKELIKLAVKNEKQAFVTTHNPAILDGLNLDDKYQNLFVVERKDEGDTTLRTVGIDDLPKPTRSGQTIKLSEAFMRGLLGGLPTNF